MMEKNVRHRKKLLELGTVLIRTVRLSVLLLLAYLLFGSIQACGLFASFAGRVMDCLQLAGYPARCAGTVFSTITKGLTQCLGSLFTFL